MHKRWDHVMDQLSSGTEQGWRVAILEADIMLKDLLDLAESLSEVKQRSGMDKPTVIT